MCECDTKVHLVVYALMSVCHCDGSSGACGPKGESRRLPTNTVDREGEKASTCSPSFPVECPGTHEPGASANAPPRLPGKSQIATLSKPTAESANVGAGVSLQKGARIPVKKTAQEAPGNTQPGLRHATLPSPEARRFT